MFRTAIILCGGRSSRMGRDKAWLPFGGEALLQRVARQVSGLVDETIVVTDPGRQLPELAAAVRVVCDPTPHEGPLQGLATGLEAARQADLVPLRGCDMPFLRPPFLQRLFGLIGDADAAVPVIDGRPHMLAAVYRPNVLPAARQLLQQGERRLRVLLETCRARTVSRAELEDVDPELESLRNINTVEEYEAALQITRGRMID